MLEDLIPVVALLVFVGTAMMLFTVVFVWSSRDKEYYDESSEEYWYPDLHPPIDHSHLDPDLRYVVALPKILSVRVDLDRFEVLEQESQTRSTEPHEI